MVKCAILLQVMWGCDWAIMIVAGSVSTCCKEWIHKACATNMLRLEQSRCASGAAMMVLMKTRVSDFADLLTRLSEYERRRVTDDSPADFVSNSRL